MHSPQTQERKCKLALLTESQLITCLNNSDLNRTDAILIILGVDVEVPKTVASIRGLGKEAGRPEIIRWNISDILGRSPGFAVKLPEGWLLTSEGRKRISQFLPSKERRIIETADGLRNIASSISDQSTVEFLNEALSCFENKLYRAAVVLSWVGAISLLQGHVVHTNIADFNREATLRDRRWKPARTRDDLGRMKESDFLDIIGCPPLSILDQNTKEELKNNCLKLRNACGHPSSLTIGENKVAAHLEILMLNIFSKFS